MSADPGNLNGRSLLAVFAHPDDESLACGGLLAWCADLGARVSLLCVTHGEDATSADLDRTALFRERARELNDAAQVLGIREVFLLDYPDGELPWLDAERAVKLKADIAETIRLLAPDVVITFGEDGLYWHPDHIAVHEATTAAVNALGSAAPALYYVTMPQGAVRALVERVERQAPEGPSHRHVLGIDDPDAFGALASPPTLVVDVTRHAVAKLRALRCHRTQVAGGALEYLREADAPALLGIEQFHRAPGGAEGATFLDQLATPQK